MRNRRLALERGWLLTSQRPMEADQAPSLKDRKLESMLPLLDWTACEVAALSLAELSTAPPSDANCEPVLAEEPTCRPRSRVEQAYPYHNYVLNVGLADVPDELPLKVDESLAPLRFTDIEPALRPVIAVAPVKSPDERVVRYYFEFDTVPTFDSPNFWRAPQLLPFQAVRDISGRDGVKYRLFTSGHHEPHMGPVARFPFRVTAMRLPDDWQVLDRAELERHALGLGYGLAGDALIREIFDWVRCTITWSRQSRVRSSLDVFCSGLSPCGQANAYCSFLLELNGVRTRGVSGFDPAIRRDSENGRGEGTWRRSISTRRPVGGTTSIRTSTCCSPEFRRPRSGEARLRGICSGPLRNCAPLSVSSCTDATLTGSIE